MQDHKASENPSYRNRKRREYITSSGQNKFYIRILEFFDTFIPAAVIPTFVIFAKFFTRFKYPVLFLADLGIKNIINPFKIAKLWQSNKPLSAKIIGTNISVLLTLLISAAITFAFKSVAAAIVSKGLVAASVMASAPPFFFTVFLGIATALSAWDLKKKVTDLLEHPWKKTKIETLKLKNKVARTLGRAIVTSTLWPIFKVGLIPLLISGKIAALASNPIGWGLSILIGVTLAGMGIYRIWSTAKMHKLQRQAARNLVDSSIDPELELDLDGKKIENEVRTELTQQFTNSYKGPEAEREQALKNYLKKGSLWNQAKAVFGGGSPLGRAYSARMQPEVEKRYNARIDKILKIPSPSSRIMGSGIVDYKWFGFKQLSDEERYQCAREDYLKYGVSRYDLAVFDNNDSNTKGKGLRKSVISSVKSQLEKNRIEFLKSEEYKQLYTLQQAKEIMINDYGRDYYYQTKKVNEHATRQDLNPSKRRSFNPYEILEVPMDASQSQIHNAYESMPKEAKKREAKNVSDNTPSAGNEGLNEQTPGISKPSPQDIEDAFECLKDKRHRHYFDVLFAVHHANYNPYEILFPNENKKSASPAEIKKRYKDKKAEITSRLQKGTHRDEELGKLNYAYRILIGKAQNSRFGARSADKFTYEEYLRGLNQKLNDNKDDSQIAREEHLPETTVKIFRSIVKATDNNKTNLEQNALPNMKQKENGSNTSPSNEKSIYSLDLLDWMNEEDSRGNDPRLNAKRKLVCSAHTNLDQFKEDVSKLFGQEEEISTSTLEMP